MHPAFALLGLSAWAAASPLGRRDASPFPSNDGFPTPNQQQLDRIQLDALGTLSNATPPANVSADGLTNLKVIALNELFEVAFFESLLSNVTNNVSGYQIENWEAREFIVTTLNTVRAQEELHAINANNALKHFGADPIQACQYVFPVTDFDSAIALANTFTSVVLGTLQDVIQIFAANGDAGLTVGIASVIGQEGEQNGYYRLLQGKVPSELPFLTTSTRDFAVNALNQTFFVPGSCPNINTITGLNVFQPLTLLTPPQAQNQDIQFSFENPAAGASTTWTPANLKVAYVNQQNVPLLVDFTVVKTSGSTTVIQASFPHDDNELNGLTIATLVDASANITDAQSVANASKFGPALITVN